jgi:glycosyltransferase involved in cell wall biosynthesis
MHIFHAAFSPHKGGMEQAFLNLTDILVGLSHRVTLLVHPDSPYLPQMQQEKLLFSPRGMVDICVAWQIRKVLKAQRPDLIIAHNSRAFGLMKWASKGLNIPLFGVTHGNKTRRMMGADKIIVLTDTMRNRFIKAGYPTERVVVIPNMIHLPQAPKPRPRNTPPVVGAIGRLVIEKGFADFLNALAIVKNNGVEFSIRIAGDGILRTELETLAKERALNVVWDGWVSDTAAFYSKIDIVCLPSHYEPFGLTILEGLTYGVPVVTTNSEGPASIITHEKNGLIAPIADVQALATHITRLLQDEAFANKLAQAGWDRAQDFSFAAISKRWQQNLTA